MAREQTLIPVDMDQEDVALRFQKYALVSAAVVDGDGRLVGMITVDDVIHIIQEEASEDVLLLSGAGDEGDINEPVSESYRRRMRWLIANLADRPGRRFHYPPVRALDRAACDPCRADANRRRRGRQCGNADACG